MFVDPAGTERCYDSTMAIMDIFNFCITFHLNLVLEAIDNDGDYLQCG